MASLAELLKKKQAGAAESKAPDATATNVETHKSIPDNVATHTSIPTAQPVKKPLFSGLKKSIVANGGNGNGQSHVESKSAAVETVSKGSQSVAASSPSVVPKDEDFNHPEMVDTLGEGDVASFREAIQILHSSFEHPELVSNATRNILISIREHPDFTKILAPEDFGAMIRAVRESHGMTVASKVLNKEKRTGKKKEIDDLTAELASAIFDTEA